MDYYVNPLSSQCSHLSSLGGGIWKKEVLSASTLITGAGKEIHVAPGWVKATWCGAGFYV
jgi:hypothetical protein